MRAWTPGRSSPRRRDGELALECSEVVLAALGRAPAGNGRRRAHQAPRRRALALVEPLEVALEHRDLHVAVVDVPEQVLEGLDLVDEGLEVVVEGDREDLEQVAQALARDPHVVELGHVGRVGHQAVVGVDLVDAHGEHLAGVRPKAAVGVEPVDGAGLGHSGLGGPGVEALHAAPRCAWRRRRRTAPRSPPPRSGRRGRRAGDPRRSSPRGSAPPGPPRRGARRRASRGGSG